MKGMAILLVDDEPLIRLSMVDALEAVGYDVHAVASGTEGLNVLREKSFDLVITDLRLPGADGLTVLKATKDRSPETEVVMITAHGSVESAVGAMKLGAFDYITKPFQMDELLLIVERVGRVIALRRENRDLKETLESKFCFNGILGANSQMRGVLDKIKTVDQPDVDVDRLIAAYPLELALLQHTQQLDLHDRRDLADFVEKEGAPMGQFKPSATLP